jgi:hypothetical protein
MSRKRSIEAGFFSGGTTMENKLYQIYLKESDTFRWFDNLNNESLKQILLSTWYSVLWNPLNVEESLLRFYGHLIDTRSVVQFIKMLKMRLIYCDTYAWGIPHDEAICTLVKHSPIIEIGAGRGYWAGLAASAGASIIAFDSNPPIKKEANNWHRQPGTFFEVSKADLDVVRMYPDRTLFLCWPPHGSDVALKTIQNYKGKTVIYVGDDGHVSSGTPEFYKEMSTYFTLVQVVHIPRWPGIQDRLEVWQRI